MKAYITVNQEIFNSITTKASNRIQAEIVKLKAIQSMDQKRPKNFTEHLFGKVDPGTGETIKTLQFLLLEIQEIAATSSFSTQVNVAQADMIQLLKWATVK